MNHLCRLIGLGAMCLPLAGVAMDCGTEIQRRQSTIDWAELRDWKARQIQELLEQAQQAELARDPLRCQKILSQVDELLGE